ncbi:MAG: HAD-IA family hydrolase [Gammaproteobacteria bacterium]|jgi:phosphoglycolate phosphatase
MPEGRYHLLVFDWDGTLADSLGHIVAAMDAAINEAGLEPRRERELLDVIGLGLEQAFAQLYPQHSASETAGLAAAYRRHYRYLADAPVTLFPGVSEVITALHTGGYRLAVATGKSRRGLDRALTQSGLGPYFHASRCSDETFSKPHPQMLIEIMERVGVPPEQTVMVGDSHHDLEMANNAGVAPVAVNYGAQPARRLLEFNPIASIHDFAELAVWLGNCTPMGAKS